MELAWGDFGPPMFLVF